jgi:hypothetical protein
MRVHIVWAKKMWGKPTHKWHYVPIAAIASIYKQVTEPTEGLIQEDETATYKDAFLLISKRMDCPEEVAKVYAKRWKIEVFYRTTKQELGLTNCHSRSGSAHFAHMELLFLAETLLCFSKWECNKEGTNEALSHNLTFFCGIGINYLQLHKTCLILLPLLYLL